MVPVKQILETKRAGEEIPTDAIREIVKAYTEGTLPDYQMSALAMAICCRGMSAREISDLTEAMMLSGRTMSWDGLVTADKHSTGGVGDKLSLIVLPVASSCGLYVPSMMGRGLGHTGGTVDKLESINGYNASLSLESLEKTVRETGLAMTSQTSEICPADKKLYALRDVTGTVSSVALITSSILSKKLAEGAGTLVFDVKCGRGAFMKTREDALELARSLVGGAKAAGRKAAALITSMDEPLGAMTGNANEVGEALDVLCGKISPLAREMTDLSIEEAALMVSLSKGIGREEARAMCREKLESGEAMEKFAHAVAAQGGDLEAFRRSLANERPGRFRISAMKSGYVTSIDALAVAEAALLLGAGRCKAGDRIDRRAGIELGVKYADRVSAGDTLATLFTATRFDDLENAADVMMKAFAVGSEPPPAKSLVLEEVL